MTLTRLRQIKKGRLVLTTNQHTSKISTVLQEADLLEEEVPRYSAFKNKEEKLEPKHRAAIWKVSSKPVLMFKHVPAAMIATCYLA